VLSCSPALLLSCLAVLLSCCLPDFKRVSNCEKVVVFASGRNVETLAASSAFDTVIETRSTDGFTDAVVAFPGSGEIRRLQPMSIESRENLILATPVPDLVSGDG
jgi:hypothetical protein